MAKISGDGVALNMLKYQIWTLKVLIHCEGCKKKVRKVLQGIEGVYRTEIDSDQHKVTVIGDVNAETLIKKLQKAGKLAELLPAEKPIDPKNSTKAVKSNTSNEKQKSQPTAHQEGDQPKGSAKVAKENGGENNNSGKSGQPTKKDSKSDEASADIGRGGGGDNNKTTKPQNASTPNNEGSKKNAPAATESPAVKAEVNKDSGDKKKESQEGAKLTKEINKVDGANENGGDDGSCDGGGKKKKKNPSPSDSARNNEGSKNVASDALVTTRSTAGEAEVAKDKGGKNKNTKEGGKPTKEDSKPNEASAEDTSGGSGANGDASGKKKKKNPPQTDSTPNNEGGKSDALPESPTGKAESAKESSGKKKDSGESAEKLKEVNKGDKADVENSNGDDGTNGDVGGKKKKKNHTQNEIKEDGKSTVTDASAASKSPAGKAEVAQENGCEKDSNSCGESYKGSKSAEANANNGSGGGGDGSGSGSGDAGGKKKKKAPQDGSTPKNEGSKNVVTDALGATESPAGKTHESTKENSGKNKNSQKRNEPTTGDSKSAESGGDADGKKKKKPENENAPNSIEGSKAMVTVALPTAESAASGHELMASSTVPLKFNPPMEHLSPRPTIYYLPPGAQLLVLTYNTGYPSPSTAPFDDPSMHAYSYSPQLPPPPPPPEPINWYSNDNDYGEGGCFIM